MASAGEILEILDRDARRFVFPSFGNTNILFLCGRLSAFSDGDVWGLVIEEFAWWPAAEGLQTVVFGWGTALTCPPGLIHPSPVESVEVLYGDNEGDYLNPEPELDAVLVRGDDTFISWSSVAPKDPKGQRMFDIGVSLVEEHRGELFGTPDELSTIVRADAPLLFQLDEWLHPDGDSLPSAVSSFQTIADALATGRADAYVAPGKTNTDWRRWRKSV